MNVFSYPFQAISIDKLNKIQKKRHLSLNNARRVLAPYVKARKKHVVEPEENKYFSFYIQKRPTIFATEEAGALLFEPLNDLLSLLEETAVALKLITNSAEVTFYMVDDSRDEIYQVTQNLRNDGFRISYKIGTETNVAAHVAATLDLIKIKDLLEDARFPLGLGNCEVTVKAVMCVPIVTPPGDCIGVFELYREMDDEEYSDNDMSLLISMCSWIGASIYETQLNVTLRVQQELNDYLVDLTRVFFNDASLFEKMISEIISFAKIALSAENACFYILRPDQEQMFADLYYNQGVGMMQTLFKKKIKIIVDSEVDVVGCVIQDQEILNIRNAENDIRTAQIRALGLFPRSVLCAPIKGAANVIGAIMLLNKRRGACFSKSDEIICQTFTSYCGFILNYNKLYQQMEKDSVMNKVLEEMLIHYMQPCIHDYYFISKNPEPPIVPSNFTHFDFMMSESYEHYLPQLVIHMFNQISGGTFDNITSMIKFVLIVQKSYRNHHYHNYQHAFYVTHTMYCMIHRNKSLFKKMEIRALMIAAYAHDMDHCGVTNAFLKLSEHFLAQLYDDCVQENHSYYITLFIIKFLKLFQYLSTEEYQELLDEIKFCILATDMCTYIVNREKLYSLYNSDKFDWQDKTHRALFKTIVMTGAYFSPYTKPFIHAKYFIQAQYEENYDVGDQITSLGFCPLPMMNRSQTDRIASNQIQFLTLIVLPCVQILTRFLPNCGTLYKEVLHTRQSYQELKDVEGLKLWSLDESYPDGRKH